MPLASLSVLDSPTGSRTTISSSAVENPSIWCMPTASIAGGRKPISATAIFGRHPSMSDSDLLLHLSLHCKRKTMGGDGDSVDVGNSDVTDSLG
ncbi:hypothetical protein ACLOJK_030773 [Asimina triloba]